MGARPRAGGDGQPASAGTVVERRGRDEARSSPLERPSGPRQGPGDLRAKVVFEGRLRVSASSNHHGGAPQDEVAELNSISREVGGQQRDVQMEARPDNIAATFVS